MTISKRFMPWPVRDHEEPPFEGRHPASVVRGDSATARRTTLASGSRADMERETGRGVWVRLSRPKRGPSPVITAPGRATGPAYGEYRMIVLNEFIR